MSETEDSGTEDEETEAATSDLGEETGEVPSDLVEEVAAHDEALAESVAALRDRNEALEAELDAVEDDLESVEADLETAEERLERTRADFRNYKERAKRQQEEIKERATEDLVERLLEVRDNLDRALEDETDSLASLREGVELTRKQFDRVLDEEDVQRIEPEPGSDVDPNRHEVMMRVEADQPAGTVASVYRPGDEMAGKVLRTAQVTVAEEDSDETTTEDDAADETDDE
jgi:molecular chaperone GrpE